METIAKRLYKNSHVWFQNLIVSLYGYKIKKQRYGAIYYNTYNHLIKKDYSNYQDELNLQLSNLKEFLKYVVNNSKFYAELYDGINLDTINSIEDLKILPIVDKEMLRTNIEDVYTINEKDGIVNFTGGTTGKSLKVVYHKDDFQKRMAYLDAFKYRVGIDDPFNSSKATFSGRDITHSNNSKIFWRYNRAYNQKLYSTFDLTEENLPLYIDDLNVFKPEIVNGFVSAIYELSEFIDRKQIKLSFLPKAIFTTSETLLPHQRKLIEKVFKTRIYNQYASAEGAPFITECLKGNLHYNIDTGVIETVETDFGNQMIITSFTTKGTPLVRYNIGDTLTLEEGTCTCGSSHPLVEKIEGRKVDYLYSKEKGKISLSHLADVIKGIPNSIKKMQFVQESEDKIDILVVVDQNKYFSEHKKSILKEMEYRFGKQTEVNILEVEDIPREKSGKFSLVKNNLHLTKTRQS
jgi:phenylacetate-CoA ligase